ncbi:uncharacterized protein LOC134529454 isoform X2 [Bacillus rossius redtenbacheri]|uniref:uncharacterized protein LOC134529454 isoform X2 n=1 Tax=Bacillus rossius redtenbacheri TaxID=93214 RepID=UPI002FDE8433
MASTPGDKTVNKVALCSAIFAGFAYVGYSVVRTAFCRRLGRREYEGYPDEHRLYFRRLSQTTQTDVLLGNLDMTGSGKVILRPMTVQERIRELNVRARMFTDTMLAIQNYGVSPRHSPLPGPRSLQCSPWSSPRILSPVDVRHILASRSSENLSGLGCHGELVGSPIRRRMCRQSLRRVTPSKNQLNLEESRHTEEATKREAEKLLREGGEEKLRNCLETLSMKERVLTKQEAKSLVALLHSNNDVLLEQTLVTIGNYGTFARNQDILREAGCLYRLQNMLTHPNISVRLAAIKATGNLALNQENQKELKDAIPLLLTFINVEQPKESIVLSALVTLANIAVLSDWHEEFYPALHSLYNLVDNGSPQVKLQALKLLVNLSCNEDMVPSLLAAQAPRRLVYLLDPLSNEEILLRVVTLLANLTSTAKELMLNPSIDLPAEDKAASPETMYAAIFGVNIQEKMRSKAFVLMNQHRSEDVRVQARKMYEAIKS